MTRLWRMNISSLWLAFFAAALLLGLATPKLVSAECDTAPLSEEKCQTAGATGSASEGGLLLGGWSVDWGVFIDYTSTQIKYSHAYTIRTSGSGAHEIEVHGALVKGWPDDQSYPYVFGPVLGYNGSVTGGTSDTWHNKDGVTWRVVSSHYYDIGPNGTYDAYCPGCLDFSWS